MKNILFACMFFLLAAVATAQERLWGTLKNAADTTISVETSLKISGPDGLNRIIKSGVDGSFSTMLPKGVYQMSITASGYLPYDRSLTLPFKAALSIGLIPSEMELGEIVFNTGYQRVDKTRATGSFSTLTSQQLSQQTGRNLLDRLESIASGLTVDKSTGTPGKFMIRGLSTIRGPKEPLIILDEVAYDGDFANINPEDVENITILKDAAAAAIWGTRAGNGVIVITTKKGKLNSPLALSFSASFAIQQKPDLYYGNRISSEDFLALEGFLFSKGFYASQITSNLKPALSPFVELLIRNAAGEISTGELDQARANLASKDVYRDFDKYLYKEGFRQQYGINLSSGTQKHSWLLSSSYTKGYSNLDALDDRSTIRFSNSFSPLKNLQFSAVFSYSGGKNKDGRPGVGAVINRTGLFPYAQFADDNGNPLALTKNYRQVYLNSLSGSKLQDWSYYPLTDYQSIDNTSTITDLFANLEVSYKLPVGFRASMKYNLEGQRNTSRILQGLNSYYARNIINSFTQISPGGQAVYPVPVGGILDNRQSDLRSQQIRPQLGFERQWGTHHLSGIAGVEWRRAVTQGIVSRMYGVDDDKLTTGLVDYSRTYPDFITGNGNYIAEGNSLSKTTTNFFSEFINLAYTFRDSYTISLSGRADASNAFGVATNNKFKPLWSAGFSWDISRMPFFKTEVLDLLKLRATYGLSGNVDPSMSALTTIRFIGNSQFNSYPYAGIDKYANPELSWETVKMLNFAMDFSLVKGRLSGSFDYYTKKGTDLFGLYPIDYTTGVGSIIIRNVAAIKGNGFDLQLNSRNLTGAFQWQSNLNLSRTKDEVTRYYLASVQGSNFVQSGATISGIEGLPVYSVFAYRSAGLDPLTGDPRGYLKGVVSKDFNALTGAATSVSDLEYMGPALPGYFGNLVNTFCFRGFSLSLALSFKLGYVFRRKSVEYNDLLNAGSGSGDYQARWQKPGDELITNVPSLIYPINSSRDNFYRFSNSLVEKGDHIRLQYINLDYNFSSSILRHIRLKSLAVFVNAANLGIIYRANGLGLDPDFSTSSYTMPQGKTFTFGLKTQL